MDSTCATFDTTLVCFRPLIDPNYWIHDVGDSLKNAILAHEKMHIFNMSFQIHNLFDFFEY
jgi:hypothetical protein